MHCGLLERRLVCPRYFNEHLNDPDVQGHLRFVLYTVKKEKKI